jgi:hypothetical protein
MKLRYKIWIYTYHAKIYLEIDIYDFILEIKPPVYQHQISLFYNAYDEQFIPSVHYDYDYHAFSALWLSCLQCTMIIMPSVHYDYHAFSALWLSWLQCTMIIMPSVHYDYHAFSALWLSCLQCTMIIMPSVHYDYHAFTALSFYALLMQLISNILLVSMPRFQGIDMSSNLIQSLF